MTGKGTRSPKLPNLTVQLPLPFRACPLGSCDSSWLGPLSKEQGRRLIGWAAGGCGHRAGQSGLGLAQALLEVKGKWLSWDWRQ